MRMRFDQAMHGQHAFRAEANRAFFRRADAVPSGPQQNAPQRTLPADRFQNQQTLLDSLKEGGF